MAIRVGDTIGEYIVEGMLGQGGMGTVFLVRNQISERREALKILVSDVTANSQIAERFLREIKVQASLSHPNIASLHTALRYNNQLLMIMELVEGETLEAKLRARVPMGTEAVGWIKQLLSALEYSHGRGVVHRDVKPANIMVIDLGIVKLLDFGIASRQDTEFRLTATGAAIGSLYYMSPEQIRTQPLDGRSDVYSTGLVLYECLTAQRPISGASAFECMQAHLSLMPPSPNYWNPLLPDSLSQAILRAIQKDPVHRFQSAAEFRHALETSAVLGAPVPNQRNDSQRMTGKHWPVPSPPTLPGTSLTPIPDGWDPKVLEQARQDLAQFIGPMAKVLVKRALRDAPTIRRLYEVLALEIADEADRKKFLALNRY